MVDNKHMSFSANKLHILIEHAALPLQAGVAQPPLPALPHFDALLGRMHIEKMQPVDADGGATALETVLMQTLGWPPGFAPWAAWQSRTYGPACAWLRPCHWQVGLDSIVLLDPRELQLSAQESRQLMASVQDLLAEYGLTLHYHGPDLWLAKGELLGHLQTRSMATALQKPIEREMMAASGQSAHSLQWRRLQNELEMLLHSLPLNQAREEQGQWTINAVWLEGAGRLEQAPAVAEDIQVEQRLAQMPLSAGQAMFEQTWLALDADVAPALLARLRSGQRARLTLCGARQALTLSSQGSWAQGLMRRFKPLKLNELIADL